MGAAGLNDSCSTCHVDDHGRLWVLRKQIRNHLLCLAGIW